MHMCVLACYFKCAWTWPCAMQKNAQASVWDCGFIRDWDYDRTGIKTADV